MLSHYHQQSFQHQPNFQYQQSYYQHQQSFHKPQQSYHYPKQQYQHSKMNKKQKQNQKQNQKHNQKQNHKQNKKKRMIQQKGKLTYEAILDNYNPKNAPPIIDIDKLTIENFYEQIKFIALQAASNAKDCHEDKPDLYHPLMNYIYTPRNATLAEFCKCEQFIVLFKYYMIPVIKHTYKDIHFYKKVFEYYQDYLTREELFILINTAIDIENNFNIILKLVFVTNSWITIKNCNFMKHLILKYHQQKHKEYYASMIYIFNHYYYNYSYDYIHNISPYVNSTFDIISYLSKKSH